jgi:putative membrane protein
MSKIVVRLLINAVALWAAARWIDGVDLSPALADVAVVALVFGLVNTFIKPVVMLLSLPALLLTLGLFTFVVNAAMLGLVAWLTEGLTVAGFGAALLGSLVVTVVSFVLNVFLSD